MKKLIIIRAFLLISILCSTCYTALSQDVQSISFEIDTALPLEGTSYSISIFRDIDNVQLKVESLKKDFREPKEAKLKEMSITMEQFDAIVNSVINIKQADVVSGPHPDFLHSVPVSISIGKLGNYISYHVASPYYLSEERNLNDFIACYELILKTAMLDSKNLPK